MIRLEESFTINKQEKADNLPLDMVWIEPGEFLMGKNFIEDTEPYDYPYQPGANPQFESVISKGFWIGQYLITYAQWLSMDSPCLKWISDDEQPVYGISWLEAMSFCKKLNLKYNDLIPKGYHFSLPTESQWEYTCRAGTTSLHYGGNTLEELRPIAQWDYKADGIHYNVTKVGLKQPNEWGIYDMLGNVQEWCFDNAAIYPNSKTIDWIGNQEDWWFEEDHTDMPEGRYRIIRGVDQSASRLYISALETILDKNIKAENLNPKVGFRISLRPITKWDLNDPLINKHNINMLGKAV